MRRALLIVSFLAVALDALAADTEYPANISRWQEVSVPPETDKGARRVWSYAANYSNYEWDVYAERGEICARLINSKTPKHRGDPKFIPKFIPNAGGHFRGQFILGFPNYAFARVEDGWLIGFDNGEFGAALHWFSSDGKRNYKVSDHQVRNFFSLSNRLHAIEGLAHMGSSEGSVIRIDRKGPNARRCTPDAMTAYGSALSTTAWCG